MTTIPLATAVAMSPTTAMTTTSSTSVKPRSGRRCAATSARRSDIGLALHDDERLGEGALAVRRLQRDLFDPEAWITRRREGRAVPVLDPGDLQVGLRPADAARWG